MKQTPKKKPKANPKKKWWWCKGCALRGTKTKVTAWYRWGLCWDCANSI